MSDPQHGPDDTQLAIDTLIAAMDQPTFNDTGLALVIHDLDTDTVRVHTHDASLPFPKVFGFPALLERLPLAEREKMRAATRNASTESGVQRFVLELPLPNGEHYWLNTTMRHYPRSRGQGVIVATLQHITEARDAHLALEASAAKLQAVVEHTEDAIGITDRAGRYVLINPSGARFFGRAPEDIIGQMPDTLGIDPVFVSDLRARRQRMMESGAPYRFEMSWPLGVPDSVLSVSEFPFWQRGRIEGTVSVARDITHLKALEQELREYASTLETRVQERTSELTILAAQLRHAASHDDLTGLPNRKLFLEELQRRIALGEPFAALFCDSDQFKLVNDSLGHFTGDELLRLMARRLQDHAPEGTVVARYGGDEFLLLLGGAHSDEALLRMIGQLTEHFRRPFLADGHEVHLTLSVGAAQSRWQYTRAVDVVRDADIAMYRAKERRRGSAVLFEPQMREHQVRLMVLQNDLAGALQRDELRVHYQPVLRASGELSGVEALVRWQHPRLGMISPMEFIGVAESSGLIRELDLWVLRRACTDLLTVPGGPCGAGVNFSAQHFAQLGLPEAIDQVLAETGFPAEKLIIEITEQLLLLDDALVGSAIQQLKARGIQVAIDDFGTGYSSLSYLHRFPLDIVKIDRAFISNMTGDPAIVRSIMQMARSLELRAVAEGVETAQQLQMLLDMGCDYTQGYLHARPLSLEELTSWLGSRFPPAE